MLDPIGRALGKPESHDRLLAPSSQGGKDGWTDYANAKNTAAAAIAASRQCCLLSTVARVAESGGMKHGYREIVHIKHKKMPH